ncbi:hypothetical protein [Mycobacterium sp. pW045]|uniref:hypothetical protein n=1 Tax=Mycobacterium sp. pW045 TaxID=3238984 RepID=UPI00351AEFDF
MAWGPHPFGGNSRRTSAPSSAPGGSLAVAIQTSRAGVPEAIAGRQFCETFS